MTKLSSTFQVHDERFLSILGPFPTLQLLAENESYPFAHEAGFFIASTNHLFITSSRIRDAQSEQSVRITRVHLNETPVKCEEIPTKIPLANGGVNYGDDGPSGLYLMSTTPPYTTKLLQEDFYGRQFSSVNDVIVHSDGSIWFTDPTYGFEQGYRPKPSLPSQVYRWNPVNGSIRAMADGFGKPNGIYFSPDEKTVYVTDTHWLHGDGNTDNQRVSSIYAFDLSTYHGEPFLTNRRLFAMADKGIPNGIKCDLDGNVYSGCGDGISAWSPGGALLGRILIDGEVANFCFGRNGEIFALNAHRLWRAQLGGDVKGTLLGI
ncbi:hypothetical protein BDV27DRAFT_140567 [Aspergillus caelatus]|uniref:SMP-30/Gluconolactonase/LRE-like region domain-containing protein n=1 Tax=Aspergillus caelatus TaxID=61420 RepID=A0A5N7AKE0_9EURO|nr:uncharacterized protein BDV27DRAFT_140567 [Aspergillus caelatus]KAE8370394.1 hypothetical protein BDV27DRAFT_140567 [Aspergillus caelatus]